MKRTIAKLVDKDYNISLCKTENYINMKPRDYFPLGLASGEAFCNRTQETKWLVDNIKVCKHSLLIAPRRYGKSSLALKAIASIDLLSEQLNFNSCADEGDIELLIRQGVSSLIRKSAISAEKIAALIKKHLSNFTPKITLGNEYAHLELSPNKQKSLAASVEELLLLLEKLLSNKNERAVFLFDEFQTVGIIANGRGVEAAIRNAAQKMKFLVIIFSGSDRHLLKSMFEDEARPLYKICRKLIIKRIDQEHYKKHLNIAAHLKWKTDLEENVFLRIMELSGRHPYYVNYLCDVIWGEYDKAPKVNDVIAAWNIVVEEEKSDAYAELSRLSLQQRKVLKHIINNSGENLLSAKTISRIGMALSSISVAITRLTEKDIIEKQEQEYVVINPVIKYLLQEEMNQPE